MLVRSTQMTSEDRFNELIHNIELVRQLRVNANGVKCLESDLDVRDRCANYLNLCRNTDYHKQLLQKLSAKEQLDQYELFYLISTINNINDIPTNVLEQAHNEWKNSILDTNIQKLMLLRRLKTETSAEMRYAVMAELKTLFSSTPHDEIGTGYFLNLRGFDFNFLTLKNLEVTFADLTGAIFDHTALYNVSVSHCIADKVNLTLGVEAYNEVTDAQGVTFTSTRLEQTKLLQDNPDSAFTIAMIDCSLNSARLRITNPYSLVMHMSHCDLQSAKLDLSQIRLDADSQENSFAGCSMVATKFRGNALIKMVDVNGAQVLRLKDSSELSDINIALSTLHENIQITRKSASKIGVAQTAIEEHSRAMSFICSRNIIDHLQAKPANERHAQLEQILQHPLFQPQSGWQQTINNGYRLADSFCSMFCRRNTGHAYFASPAMRQLEKARDEALLSLGKSANVH